MKKILVIAALLLGFVSAYAQNGKSIYMKYSDAVDVSAVYVSPTMFRLIGRIPDIKTGDADVNLTSVIRGLSGLYIINSTNASINDNLAKDVKKFLGLGTFELLMEVKSDGETMHMYTSGDERTVTNFVMLSQDNEETTFICIDGKLDREQLEVIMADSLKQ